MGDDLECLGNKLLSNLDAEFRNDPEIDEYDLLPVADSSTNRNPVRVIDHKLAMDLWAVKILFCSASKELRQWYLCRGKSQLSTDTVYLCSLTRAVLLVTADHLTAWNIRKQLVQSYLLHIEEDLKLSQLILTKHPKSGETFAHRKWLLDWWGRTHNDDNSDNIKSPQQSSSPGHDNIRCQQQHTSSGHCSNTSLVHHGMPLSLSALQLPCRSHRHSAARHRLACAELSVCERAGDKYASNYHAWTHRQFVLREFTCCFNQILDEELERTLRFVNCHVSDYSGFHYRQCLLSLTVAAATHSTPAEGLSSTTNITSTDSQSKALVDLSDTSAVTKSTAGSAVTTVSVLSSKAPVAASIVSEALATTSVESASKAAAAVAEDQTSFCPVFCDQNSTTIHSPDVRSTNSTSSVIISTHLSDVSSISPESCDMITTHSSDDSSISPESCLKVNAIAHSPDVISLLSDELRLTENLILSYPGHEALWNHRKYVIVTYLSSATTHTQSLTLSSQESPYSAFVETPSGDAASPTILPHKKSRIEQNTTCTAGKYAMLCCEKLLCERILKNCRSSGEKWQQRLAEKYLQWLERVTRSGQGSVM